MVPKIARLWWTQDYVKRLLDYDPRVASSVGEVTTPVSLPGPRLVRCEAISPLSRCTALCCPILTLHGYG